MGFGGSGGRRRHFQCIDRHRLVSNVHPAPFDDEPILTERADRRWKEPVFDLQHSRRQCGLVIAVTHGNGALHHDRTMVDVDRHEMDGTTMNPHAVGERATVRAKTGI